MLALRSAVLQLNQLGYRLPNNCSQQTEHPTLAQHCGCLLPLLQRVQHDWTACFYLHRDERARRRDLRTHKYAAVMCCNMLQQVQ
jgi:hypothetical protein